jgi:protein SCO1/2
MIRPVALARSTAQNFSPACEGFAVDRRQRDETGRTGATLFAAVPGGEVSRRSTIGATRRRPRREVSLPRFSWRMVAALRELLGSRARCLLVLAALALISAPALAQGPAPATGGSLGPPPGLFDVGVDEHLDAQVPLDTEFLDSTGKAVRFGDFVDGKRPVVLVLAYHTCKTLCSFVQNAVLNAAKSIKWSIGDQYDVITLSIDSNDTVKVAAEKKAAMDASYGRPGAVKGWHYLVGTNENSKRVADAVGWKFHKDIDGNIAHPAAIMLLKPNGKVARYLYGIEFTPNDFRLGLLDASQGKSITTAERILLYCYHYDAGNRKYTLLATHVMQLGGALTLLVVSVFVGGFWISERRKNKKHASSDAPPSKAPPSKVPPAGDDSTSAHGGNPTDQAHQGT